MRFNPVQQAKNQASLSGRRRGAINYTPDEVDTLLDLMTDELPVGGKGWAVVGARFRDFSRISEFPLQLYRSLRVKFGQVRRELECLLLSC